ncbi:MAG: hypothetical protein CFE44_02930 [Burkholderiales bacterium PBB4]|nr:MAG: hypothetical protein CFE44_02930 [Burkholderiales bacterium PBB4]
MATAITVGNNRIFDQLIAAGAGKDFTKAHWNSHFRLAVEADKLTFAKRLVALGAEPAFSNNVDILTSARSNAMRDFLLDNGVNPRGSHPLFVTPDALTLAVLRDDLEVVKYLVRRVSYKKSELLAAINKSMCRPSSSYVPDWNSEKAFLDNLHALGLNGKQLDQSILSCLLIRQSPALVAAMQKSGVVFHYSGLTEDHPFLAVNPEKSPTPEYLELLESQGLLWDKKEHGALMMGKLGFRTLELAKWLISRGVNVNVEIAGEPIMIAFVKYLHNRDVIGRPTAGQEAPLVGKFLLDAGAKADARDQLGLNALWWEAKLNYGGETMMKHLLTHGASPDVHGEENNWVVHLAAQGLSTTDESMEALAAHKSNWNVRDYHGLTPLHHLARKFSLLEPVCPMGCAEDEILKKKRLVNYVQLLLKHGADIKIRDATGRLPIDLLEEPKDIAEDRQMRELLTP